MNQPQHIKRADFAGALETSSKTRLRDVDYCAEYLGISKVSFYRLIRSGELKTCLIAGRRKSTEAWMDEYAESHVDDRFSGASAHGAQ